MKKKNLLKMKHLLIVFVLLAFSCNPPAIKDNKKTEDTPSSKSEKTDANYIVALSKIDNNVNIYVNDSLIFKSGTIHDSPEVDFEVDFSAYINDGSETLKIELWNGVEPYNEQIDPLWEVMYDLIIDGEIVDFIHEYGDDNAIGVVYENTYVINEWK